MELTDDDVLEILKLFEQSKFDFLQLQQGDRNITVSKGGYGAARATAASVAAAAAPASSPAPPQSPVLPAPKAQVAVTAAGLVPITAPVVGKFYTAASPADPPYAQPGSKVA